MFLSDKVNAPAAESTDRKEEKRKTAVSPTQLLVIAGLLTDVLEVQSILVDRDQTIQIILAGTFKRQPSQDKAMGQIKPSVFDNVMKTLLESIG